MEGLYAGGGAVVENVGDWNGNGKGEVLFSVNWPGYGEYFLVEWDGEKFVSLIEYRNRLGATCYWIEVFGQEVEIVDIDGDGYDEIMAGYAMLNSDGSVRWVYQSKTVDQARGHLDCVRVFQRGEKPEDFRLVLTCCGANNLALVDGTGGIIWEVAGHHFESVDVGRVFPGVSGQQIVVDIDHQPLGNSPVWTLDEKGELLGKLVTDYSRHHCLLDWTGDGVDEILVAHNGGIYDCHGRRIGILAVPDGSQSGQRRGERSMLIGDMTGDGVRDVIMAAPQKVYIYINKK